LLRDVPDSPRALVLLGKAHEMQGTPALSEDQFAPRLSGEQDGACFRHRLCGIPAPPGPSPARAEKLLAEIIVARPGFVPALKLLAQARSDQGNWSGVQQANSEIRRLAADLGNEVGKGLPTYG